MWHGARPSSCGQTPARLTIFCTNWCSSEREREDFALGTGLWESEFVETMWGSSLPLHSRLPSTHMLVM